MLTIFLLLLKVLPLKEELTKNSVLQFTQELSINDKLPFLDILLDASSGERLYTSEYTKPTKTLDCFNYEGDAPERYKTGVLKTLLNRAYKICNTEAAITQETQRIKHLLVNNGFPNSLCDKIIKQFKQKQRAIDEEGEHGQQDEDVIDQEGEHGQEDGDIDQSRVGNGAVNPQRVVKIFYLNQFHCNYRIDETRIRKIIKDHVFQVSVKLDLIIYYKSKRVSDRLIRNNITSNVLPKHLKNHVVYEFTCNLGECMSLPNKNSYIGMTTMTLKDRLTAHKYKGSIFAHLRTVHGVNPDINVMLDNTNILYHENDQFQLQVYEALHIRKFKPSLNENQRDFTCLKLNIF